MTDTPRPRTFTLADTLVTQPCTYFGCPRKAINQDRHEFGVRTVEGFIFQVGIVGLCADHLAEYAAYTPGAKQEARVNADQQDAVRALAELVAEQAEDEGLWFIATTASEAYLQQELRRLHHLIETGVGDAG